MYRIMIVKSHRDNNKSLYQWYLSIDSNDTSIYETDSIIELSDEVEKVAKNEPADNILVVNNVDFDIEVLIGDDVALLQETLIGTNDNLNFRMLIIRSHRDNNKSLYQWYLKNDVIYETNNLIELSDEVEEVLNTIPCEDILIINSVDFSIEALINGEEISGSDIMNIEDVDKMYTDVKNNVYNN